jgi:signal transduction histidine kinase
MAAMSLRARWVLVAAVFIVVALAAAALLLDSSFQRALDRERISDLEATFKRLAAQIEPGRTPPLSGDLLDDPRYDTPLSGVYWQVQDLRTGEIYRSRSLWDGALSPAPDSDAPIVLTGPNAETLIAASRTLSFDGETGSGEYRITVAEPRENPEQAASKFGSDIVLTLSAVAIALSAAVAIQIWLGIRPLRALLAAVEAVRAGGAERVRGAYPTEVQPLADAMNALLTAHDDSLRAARHRAADLAHGLQTPIAVLQATAERMRGRGDKANADTIELLTAEMSERVAYQLKIARLRTPTKVQRLSSSLNNAVLRGVSVLRKTPRGELLNWRVDLLEQIDVDVDQHDLIELIGVLLENATKWARQDILVKAQVDGNDAVLEVSDDGRELTDAEIVRLGQRGTRLDESAPGHGLGLAIALEVVRLNGGSIVLSRATEGGLRVNARLPLAPRPNPS